MDKMMYRFPLDDDFYVVENEVATKDDIDEYEWYLTLLGELIVKDSGPEFHNGYEIREDDELIWEKDERDYRMLMNWRKNFHVKIPEHKMPIFMLKYGGIIKKSPAYVYRVG